MKTLFRTLLALSLIHPLAGYSDSSTTDIGDYHLTNADTSTASGAAWGPGLLYYGVATLIHTGQNLDTENRVPFNTLYSGNGPGTLDPTGRHLVMGVQDMGAGVTLQRKVYVPTNNSFIRWVNKVVNTSDEDVEVDLYLEGILNGESVVAFSTNENEILETSDDWIITDSFIGPPDETRIIDSSEDLINNTLLHVLNGSGDGPELGDSFFDEGDMEWTYNFQLPAGETVVVMHFVSDLTEDGGLDVDGDFVYALAGGYAPDALNFMTQEEYSQLLSEYPGTIGLGNSGSDGGCFIATAAFGTPMAQEIDTLRNVRDSYMLNNAVGAAFVDTYYRLSPAVADKVAGHPTLAAVIRIVLVPVVMIGNIILSSPMVLVSTLVVGAGLLIARSRRKSFSA